MYYFKVVIHGSQMFEYYVKGEWSLKIIYRKKAHLTIKPDTPYKT